jgi:uncharacterized protein with GYD domain
MPTYVGLLRFTDQGIKAIKDSPKRRAAAEKAVAAMGGKIVHTYLTLGRYDLVSIIEAPDDETAAKIALVTGSQGFVSTETMRAFTEAEYDGLIKALPAAGRRTGS